MTQRVFPSRPELLEGRTDTAETPIGRAYVTVNFLDSQPIEVFVTLGKSGSTERAAAEALGRLLSVSLQHGVPLGALTRQLRGVSSEGATGFGPNKILSMPDAVGRVLERFLKEDK